MEQSYLNTPLSIHYDYYLMSKLKELSIIESKADLGRLCGKNESYVRCMHSKGYGIHIGSLAVLQFKLLLKQQIEPNQNRLSNLSEAMKVVQQTMHNKCLAQRYADDHTIIKTQENIRRRL